MSVGLQPSPPPIPPRRSIGECSNTAQTIDHVTGRCAIHADNFYTVLCTDCVQLLCNQCLRIPERHAECTLCHLNDDTSVLRENVSASAVRHTDDLVKSMKNLRRSLMKKRERMIKKKNETVSEIERYFTKLRSKIITKLKRDESRLMEKLKESVTEQESLVSDSVNECETILNTVREKGAMLKQLPSGSNDLASIINIVNVQKEIDTLKTKKTEVEKTRDAFLVIRFFVNSDTEDVMLKSSPACVEVLNSRSNNENLVNLESERINEVSLLQASGYDSDVHSDASANGYDYEGLTVTNFPPSSESLSVTSLPSPPEITTENNSTAPNTDPQTPVSVVHQRSSSNPLSSRASSRNSNRGSHNSSRASTPNDLLSTSVNGSRSNTPEYRSSTPVVLSSIPNAPDSDNDHQPERPTSLELQTDIENQFNANPPEETQPQPTQANTNSTDDTIPFEDEPPPPYPGLPVQPGPDELPPPYPGPPPPPYAQNPEPQQPSTSRPRSRLFGESGRPRAASPVQTEVLLSPGRTSSPDSQLEPNIVSVKQVKSFSISEISDKRSSSISAMAVFSGRYFLVVDRWNKKLKYFSARGESYGGLIFREEPWDIAEITTDLFAVTVPKLNSIYKIQGTGNQIIAKSTVITERQYACVTYQSQNEVFVCGQVPQFGEPVIDVIGINGGPVLLTFRTTIHGRELFSYPRYVKVSNDNVVVVCDWNIKCVVFFKSDGTIIARYKGTTEYPLQEPTGITLNREINKVFVIDSKRDSTQGVIHRVSMDGLCEHVYERQDDFRDSRAISSYGDRISTGSKSGIINTYTTANARTTRQRLT